MILLCKRFKRYGYDFKGAKFDAEYLLGGIGSTLG